MTIIKHFALCAIGLSMSLALGACKNNGTAANENNADEPLCAVKFSADSALASIKRNVTSAHACRERKPIDAALTISWKS